MRLIADAWLQADFVNAFCDFFNRSICRQGLASSVDITRDRHRLGSQWHQRIRALEVVVLQRGFVHLCRKGDFVLGIGLHRIKVLGTLGKGRIEDVLATLCMRIGIVPHLATCTKEKSGQRNEKTP